MKVPPPARHPLASLCLLGIAVTAAANGTEDSTREEVWLGDHLAVSYAARIEADWLIVDVQHEPGWHTYAMDNVLRAAEVTGKDKPDTELPTRITPSPEIELESPWRQTAPTELSQPDLRWYTWGFEERSFFAARVLRAGSGGWVQVDAQACTDQLCAMVDGLRVPVTRSGERTVVPESLAVVRSAEREEAAAVREQLAVFGDWFQRAMDLDCSGRAPVGRLVEIMNPGRHRPRQMNWVMDLDADGDGFVEPGEVGAGLWQSLEHQVERRMLGDVDGDGVLSPREYALFVPDPGAERNADGMSRLQEARLANLDRNGDRRVSRLEVVDDFATSYITRHWSRILLFHFSRADSDGDGAVTQRELASAIRTAGGAATPARLQVWFDAARAGRTKTSVPQLSLATLPDLLNKVGASAESRTKFEASLGPLVARPCIPTVTAGPP